VVKYERLSPKLNKLSLTLSLCDNQSNSWIWMKRLKAMNWRHYRWKSVSDGWRAVSLIWTKEFTQIEEILHNVWPLLHTFESLVKLDQLLTHLATIATIHKNLSTHVVNSKNSKGLRDQSGCHQWVVHRNWSMSTMISMKYTAMR